MELWGALWRELWGELWSERAIELRSYGALERTAGRTMGRAMVRASHGATELWSSVASSGASCGASHGESEPWTYGARELCSALWGEPWGERRRRLFPCGCIEGRDPISPARETHAHKKATGHPCSPTARRMPCV